MRFQNLCPFFIIFFLFKMLTSIKFNDQFLTRRAKVYNVITNGVLSAECNVQLIVSYPRPEFLFGRRRFLSQLYCLMFCMWVASQWARHICPLLASPICSPRRTVG